jgi:hypothetical protein
MPNANQQPPKTQRRFGTIWGELEYVCKRIHYWLYRRKSPSSARRCLSRLERILNQLPDNDLAILREEGLALLHELKGQRRGAIEHRQREIQLTERLRKSVQKSVHAGDYDERMGESILANRDGAALEERRAILRHLQEQADPRHARNPNQLVKGAKS